MPVVFAIPGDLASPTGGYGYDRRLLTGLCDLGHDVAHLALPGSFPFPSAEDLAATAAAFAAIGDGTSVLVDGLALGAMPEIVRAEAGRLDLVALLHHPLGLETGLGPEEAARLTASENAALPFVRHVVVTSAATARLVRDLFGVADRRITVALPGTDRAARATGAGDPPHLVSVGSLIARKGHDTLIDALALIKDRRWRATIAGSAPDPAHAASLRARAADAGLAGRITFAGAVADVRALMALGDVFVLASRFEGYGMAFAEAMTQGLPVVACRAGAVPDVVPDSAGLLVAPDDPAALADELSRLLDDPDLRARLADGAFAAGARLPRWTDTARAVAGVLARAPVPFPTPLEHTT
ncbi:glycosyltransferase family 4 protein [Methylobrevis pamukkalensis]|uniref:Alpha-D-kanosaminyltransferase n=1 Tax=Methylobrevis pamukkalensis TaxID=1439726 RepID=A0A1E3H4A2_9HYPH|nr:glycosyltransferase family 4 protein [Methylobrevis pamukkalensis]ODN70985.1 Alpha-D-kanosaminyltransferase [Methylobrevis pamukkalensis]